MRYEVNIMTVKTYSLDEEVAEKFKQETPQQETSKVLEQLMRDYVDDAPEKDIQVDLQKLSLSDSQQELLDAMVERNITEKTTNSMFGMARKKSIYGRSHHFSEGLGSLVKNDEVPYTKNSNGKIIPEEVECSCESSFYLNVLIDNDCKCLDCDKVIVRL